MKTYMTSYRKEICNKTMNKFPCNECLLLGICKSKIQINKRLNSIEFLLCKIEIIIESCSLLKEYIIKHINKNKGELKLSNSIFKDTDFWLYSFLIMNNSNNMLIDEFDYDLYHPSDYIYLFKSIYTIPDIITDNIIDIFFKNQTELWTNFTNYEKCDRNALILSVVKGLVLIKCIENIDNRIYKTIGRNFKKNTITAYNIETPLNITNKNIVAYSDNLRP